MSFYEVYTRSVLSICSCLFIVSCGGSDSSDPPPVTTTYDNLSIVNSRLKVETSLSYSPSGDASDRHGLITVSSSRVDLLSVKLEVDPSSSVTPNARIEADIRLVYQPSASVGFENEIFTVMRLRDTGSSTSPQAQAFMGMCLDASCTTEVFEEPPVSSAPNALVLYSSIGNWNTENTISVAWDQATQHFIFSLNSQSISLPISNFNNNAGVMSKGVTFDPDDFKYAEIRATVKGVDMSGESGEIIAYFDDIEFDGLVYDDFSSAEIDTSKWTVND